MSIAPPPANWSEAILQTARLFMNGEICIFSEEQVVPPNVITGDDGVVGVNIPWIGKARIQHIRAPRTFEEQYQAESTRFFRFQIDPEDNPPQIPFGTKIRVLDGGRDSDLENLVYVVNSAINSSHMAARTIEASSNMEFVTWGWSPDVPARPYGLTASAITDSGFTVTWSAPPGDPVAGQYQWELDGVPTLAPVSVLTHPFTGLADDTTYTVRVRARVDALGAWGAWSAPLSVKTLAVTP